MHLDGSTQKVALKSLVEALDFSSSQHAKTDFNNAESYLKEQDLKLPKRAEIPIQTICRTDLDVSPELEPKEDSYFQSLIDLLY